MDKTTGLEGGHLPPLEGAGRILAVRPKVFGVGAERIVYRCNLATGLDTSSFVGGKLVAKESKYIAEEGTDVDHINFHKIFCKTQFIASELAHEFNRHVAALPGYDPETTPTISFLDCEVLIIDRGDRGLKGMLVEKMIDDSKYTKWNSNGGMVKGQAGGAGAEHRPIDIELELARLSIGQGASGGAAAAVQEEAKLGVIAEGDSDLESDSEGEEDEEEEDDNAFGDEQVKGLAGVPAEAFPQAFSHFTYRYTQRKKLVCDLQGVFTETSPPSFELTDPAIHYKSTRNRRGVFGRTDRDKKGMKMFFDTHKCTDLCRLLAPVTSGGKKQRNRQRKMQNLRPSAVL